MPLNFTTCAACGAEFQRAPRQAAAGKGKYCSRACANAGNTLRAVPLAVRFWRHVAKSAGCWLWTASTDANGYGRINDGSGKPILVTRLSWEMHNGPIPDGMNICHHCDNPTCVRPEHLFLGDQAANMADCSTKGRTTRGERGASAKLNEQQVRDIRTRYAQGGISQAALGREYGLCQATIRELLIRETWKHID